MVIPFNKPYISGRELEYISDAVSRGKISGNGYYTQKCHEFFQDRYGFKKCLLTTSCTDAIEMAAILCDIQPGDEVIMPSYTFVSTANAFILRGAKVVFADSRVDHPGMDEDKIEELITEHTKAIVPVHYAGVACDMDKILALSEKYNLLVIEDAAQSIESKYKGRPLGGIGNFGCFSFHETKNLQCGEGGMLVINDERFMKRSELIWEKGTNRAEFLKGEINKYGWVDIGSSFLPPEILAAFLYAQLENIDIIQSKRKEIWNMYFESLNNLELKSILQLPVIPYYATNNAHMFYIICKAENIRNEILNYLKKNEIGAVFHYISLHKSDYYKNKHSGGELKNSDRYTVCLIRLPFFNELSIIDLKNIVKCLGSCEL
jgi:dTDP-4-amino-4,6-dideoxygalactose transaminase